MKFIRTIAAIVILSIACAPAFASVCASACVATDLAAKTPASAAAMSSMTNCDMHQAKQIAHEKTQSNEGHKNCSMAGCHFASSAPLAATVPVGILDFSRLVLQQYDAFAISADLSPPIKPPA